MPRIGWVTDLHLDWVERPRRFEFYKTLQAAGLDALLIGGDIGLAQTLPSLLSEIEEAIDAPIYCVLGNHDFCGSSIAAVRNQVRRHAASRLTWLTSAGVVKLSE